MKALFTVIISFTTLSIFAQSWCDAGANWKYSNINGTGPEGYTEISYIGDTIINGQTAQKLNKHIYAYDYWASQNVDFDTGTEYTYEDNSVIYLWYNSSWDTLYNFNASVGESWRMAKQPLLDACDSNSVLTVTGTGTMTINSITLNYLVVDFSFPFGFTDTIVEKIGFISSYMFPYDECDGVLDANEGGAFRCYQDDNFATYKPHFSEACDYLVGINENSLNVNIKIVPNPAVDQIELIGELQPDSKFIITDCFGKNWSIEGNNKIINVSHLPDGVYILSVINGSGIAHRRFVISN